MKRVYKKFKKQEFQNKMAEVDWRPVLESEDTNDSTAIFCNMYSHVLSDVAPVKVVQNRKYYVPYISPEIEQLMSERNILKQRAGNENDADLYRLYKEKRNMVTNKLRCAKKEHTSAKFSDNDLVSEM